MYYYNICLRGMRKTTISLGIVRLAVKIRTKYSSNTIQKRYRLIQIFLHVNVIIFDIFRTLLKLIT